MRQQNRNSQRVLSLGTGKAQGSSLVGRVGVNGVPGAPVGTRASLGMLGERWFLTMF